ncbi:DUF2125 domain-containing protein [Rhizobium sp. SG2393]|uniref:DUF2125 domain-containing protein n=1 Tax=Rhizobium sp. SG2393 TaxID=3276279 RepID=UPI00366C26A5
MSLSTDPMPADGDSGASRKMLRLFIGVVVFIALYTGLWFLAARQAENYVTRLLAVAGADGLSGQCAGLKVSGYPFRIGLFCDNVKLDDVSIGASFTSGALRSAAQIYNPGHSVIELDAPAEFRMTPDLAVTANWDRLRASLRAGLSSISRFSSESDNLAVNLSLLTIGETGRLTAAHGEFHARQNGTALDVAASLDKPVLTIGGQPLTASAVSVDMTLADKAGLMNYDMALPDGIDQDAGTLNRVAVDLGNGMTGDLSGPFTVDGDGLVSGEFTLAMTNLEGWRQALAALLPDDRDTIDNVMNAIKALSGQKDRASVKLTARKGTVFLTLIPLFVIPPL